MVLSFEPEVQSVLMIIAGVLFRSWFGANKTYETVVRAAHNDLIDFLSDTSRRHKAGFS